MRSACLPPSTRAGCRATEVSQGRFREAVLSGSVGVRGVCACVRGFVCGAPVGVWGPSRRGGAFVTSPFNTNREIESLEKSALIEKRACES